MLKFIAYFNIIHANLHKTSKRNVFVNLAFGMKIC